VRRIGARSVVEVSGHKPVTPKLRSCVDDRARAGVFGLLLAVASSSGCSKKNDDPGPLDIPPPPGRANLQALTTDVGEGRGLDAQIAPTSVSWKRVVPIDTERALLAGETTGEAYAVMTTDAGRSFTGMSAKVTGTPVWTLGEDGTVVLAEWRRQIPKRPLPKDTLPPIDTLTVYFGSLGQKLAAPSALLAPDEKQTTPVVPYGQALPAVLGPALASFVVELRPKQYALAFAVGPGDALPPPDLLPRNEQPIAAPYGRPAQLLSVVQNRLIVRPWPRPGQAPANAKPVERVVHTKTLVEELSQGPECESGEWSFKRVSQPGNKTIVIGVSSKRTVAFELPATVVNTSPMGCSQTRIAVEAIHPVEKLPNLVACSIEGECVPPENRPFLKPWVESHERTLAVAATPKGVIAFQGLVAPTRWGLYASQSNDGGKLFDLERKVGEGSGDRGRMQAGTLVGLGERTLFLLTADITGTTRRNWFVMATDDGGQTWTSP